jgi:hypothetical protein
MTATQGVLGINTQLKLGNGASPEVFTLVRDIFGAIDGPEVTQEYVDFTHMQSTGGFRERKASFKTPGNLTFTCHYVTGDTQHEAIVAAATAVPTTLQNYQVTYPDATVIEFSAYPSVKFNADMAGKFTMAVTLGLEGAFTLV